VEVVGFTFREESKIGLVLLLAHLQALAVDARHQGTPAEGDPRESGAIAVDLPFDPRRLDKIGRVWRCRFPAALPVDVEIHAGELDAFETDCAPDGRLILVVE